MRVSFLPTAQRELDDAFEWYCLKSENPALEFIDELDRAVRRAAAHPHAGFELETGIRRCLLARFPYGILYSIEENYLLIIAVAHLHRKPRYWVGRLDRDGE